MGSPSFPFEAEYTERMQPLQIVVCGSIVPDPLQTLEPVAGPALKNEMMLPSVLDPWAAHALYEAANLAKNVSGAKVWLVSLGPKAKLQQVMMIVAQKVPFEFVALDGPAGGFTECSEVAAALAETIQGIPGLDRSRLLVFGGWESASRGTGATMQMIGERLGIVVTGVYRATLRYNTADPVNPTVSIPVTMNVGQLVTLTKQAQESAFYMNNETLHYTMVATDIESKAAPAAKKPAKGK